MSVPDTSEETKARFMKYIEKDESTGCWIWKGSRAVTGYSNFFYMGKTSLAHRVCLLLFGVKTVLTAGLFCCHTCRNRGCCNPAHIVEKTREENNGEDKRRDGTDCSGEKCHFSKLDWQQVKEIRESEGVNQGILAEQYGVSKSCISSVICCKTWKKKE